MKDWEYHYRAAEQMLLRCADSAYLSLAQQEAYALQAQAHATLATIKYKLPEDTP